MSAATKNPLTPTTKPNVFGGTGGNGGKGGDKGGKGGLGGRPKVELDDKSGFQDIHGGKGGDGGECDHTVKHYGTGGDGGVGQGPVFE
ncbi:hypothetical protein K438DRAFT_2024770, partial [Mycena galopus ATCC 62051]